MFTMTTCFCLSFFAFSIAKFISRSANSEACDSLESMKRKTEQEFMPSTMSCVNCAAPLSMAFRSIQHSAPVACSISVFIAFTCSRFQRL